MDASFQYTTHHTIPDNVILPITFIHGNTAVLSGTSYGCAHITTVEDRTLAESLQHDSSEDIVQALVLLRGVAKLEIWYWIQEPESDTKKATELKSHAAQEPGRVHHTTHVRYRISGPPIPAEALLADASSNNRYYHVQHSNPLGRNAVGYDHIRSPIGLKTGQEPQRPAKP
ncbi:hypothetical protein H4582DRAFT_2058844 [Lactarius indigo]|nr:hypothetical protein H4582DRAFT_2058844 [Lactarius indigo]